MARLLRVLVEYPGVGRPGELIAVENTVHDADSLVSVGIAEWVTDREVKVGRRPLVVEDTTRTPALERAIAVERGSTGGEVTRRGPKRASTSVTSHSDEAEHPRRNESRSNRGDR